MTELRNDWFVESKFGIFMHYGLYSQVARGEWTMYQEKMSCEECAELAKTFCADGYDARRLAQMAKEAGAGYMVLTSRHHEGFCLYDSKVSDFNSMKVLGRDLIAEHIAACREFGLKVGIYYSLLDWRYRGYHDREKFPESKEKMVEQAFAQVRELLTNYGKIDYLWFDGGWFPDTLPVDDAENRRIFAELWRAEELLSMARQLQPEILINDRAGIPGDVITPEQGTKGSVDERHSEACMTIGDRWGWGYIHNSLNFKTTRHLLQQIIIQASLGGNFLLNLGICPDGSCRDREADILAELGQWLRVNGESFYGTNAAPASVMSIIGDITSKGNCLYYHIFRWPHRGEAILSGLYQKVVSVTLLEDGRSFPFRQEQNGRLVIGKLPYLPPDTRDTVLKITLSEEICSEAADTVYGIL